VGLCLALYVKLSIWCCCLFVLPDHCSGLRRPAECRHLNVDTPMDEVVVACPPACNNSEARGRAIYVRAVADLDGGTTHALFATTSGTPCHRGCCSRADAGRARSRAPIALAIAYSGQSSSRSSFFSFFGGTQ
jgi:hypothetical protein